MSDGPHYELPPQPSFAPSVAAGQLILRENLVALDRYEPRRGKPVVGAQSFTALAALRGTRVVVNSLEDYQPPEELDPSAEIPLVIAVTRAAELYPQSYGTSGRAIDVASLRDTLKLWFRSERPLKAAPATIGEARLLFLARYANRTAGRDLLEDAFPEHLPSYENPTTHDPKPLLPKYEVSGQEHALVTADAIVSFLTRAGWTKAQAAKLRVASRTLAEEAIIRELSPVSWNWYEPCEVVPGVFCLGRVGGYWGKITWGIAPQRYLELVDQVPPEMSHLQAHRGAVLYAAAVRQELDTTAGIAAHDATEVADAPPPKTPRGPFRVITRRAGQADEL